jgi:hypothetical protein
MHTLLPNLEQQRLPVVAGNRALHRVLCISERHVESAVHSCQFANAASTEVARLRPRLPSCAADVRVLEEAMSGIHPAVAPGCISRHRSTTGPHALALRRLLAGCSSGTSTLMAPIKQSSPMAASKHPSPESPGPQKAVCFIGDGPRHLQQ